MSDLTKEQIDQLREATKLLFANSLTLGREIPDMLKRAARRQRQARLASGAQAGNNTNLLTTSWSAPDPQISKR
jgi:hypothetical protein